MQLFFKISLSLLLSGTGLLSLPVYGSEGEIPTKSETAKVIPLIDELTRDLMKSVSDGGKTSSEAADELVSYVDDADQNASKYILLTRAYGLYMKDKKYNEALAITQKLAELFPKYDSTEAELAIFETAFRQAQGRDIDEVLALLNSRLAAMIEKPDATDTDRFTRLVLSFKNKIPKSDNYQTFLALSSKAAAAKQANLKLAAKKNQADSPDADGKVKREYADMLVTGTGDWHTALRYYAQSDNEEIKKIAAAELGDEFGENECYNMANSWWTLSEKDPVSKDKTLATAYKVHAADLYGIICNELSGLKRKLVESRIEEPAKLAAASEAPATHKALTAAPRGSISIDLAKGVKLDLLKISKGSFTMGASPDTVMRGNVRYQSKVTLTNDFWIGKYEITQAQWEAVTGSPSMSSFRSPNLPAHNISWFQAMEFCAKLTERERKSKRLPDGYVYTLPTEAQWEYACRAGSKKDFANNGELDKDNPTGTSSDLDKLGWYAGNSGNTPHEPGGKKANSWGLYDMHGNIAEWCSGTQYGGMDGANTTDPDGQPPSNTTTSSRIYKGGSFLDSAYACRSFMRFSRSNFSNNTMMGFRVALVKPVAGQDSEEVIKSFSIAGGSSSSGSSSYVYYSAPQILPGFDAPDDFVTKSGFFAKGPVTLKSSRGGFVVSESYYSNLPAAGTSYQYFDRSTQQYRYTVHRDVKLEDGTIAKVPTYALMAPKTASTPSVLRVGLTAESQKVNFIMAGGEITVTTGSAPVIKVNIPGADMETLKVKSFKFENGRQTMFRFKITTSTITVYINEIQTASIKGRFDKGFQGVYILDGTASVRQMSTGSN